MQRFARFFTLVAVGLGLLAPLRADPLVTTPDVYAFLSASNFGTMRSTLGVAIGTNVQAYDADLTLFGSVTPSANGLSLVSAADYAAMKSLLSLGNVQNTALTTWAGSTSLITLGTVTTGTWNGSVIAPAYLGSGTSITGKFLRGDGTWQTLGAGAGDMLAANNLSDVASAATARTNLGLAIGTNVQAYDADLTTYAAITPSANAQAILGAVDYAAMKTLLSLNNVQNTALSTWTGSMNLTTLGTITIGTWNGSIVAPAYLGTGTSITTKYLRGDGTWQTLGAGSGDMLAANNLSDVASVSTARTNLGLAIGTNVQAFNANLTTWAGVTPGTGIAAALAVNTGSAGAPVLFGGAGGMPSSITLTNASGTASININGTVGATTPSTGAFTTGAFSGAVTNSVAGAASTPAEMFTGAIFTGGTGTTTFPHWLIQPTGTTAGTTWSTAGTLIGLNAPSGFTGELISARINGAGTLFSIASAGLMINGGCTVSGSTGLIFNARAKILSLADGDIRLSNNAATDFGRVQYGGTTSGYTSHRPTSAQSLTATVTIASPGVFTATAHGFIAGDLVSVTSTGALPTGILPATLYYVTATSLAANTFTVAATLGGTAITTTGSQSGTHTAARLAETYFRNGDNSAETGVRALAFNGNTVTTGTGVLTLAAGKTLTANQTTMLDRQASTGLPVEFCVAAGDEATALTTGTGKVTFRAPYAFTITELRASVNTAPTGATILVDVNESGTTVISTKIMIDATEKTSQTAATPYVISDSAIADDAELSIDIDQVGSSVAGAGLKIWIKGYR